MVSDRFVPGGPARMGSSRVARWPHLGLRSVVTRPYAGITGAIEQPGGFVLPATASVLLVMKVVDSALRPPQFVHGAHATYATIDGACAPFYAQVSLAPLGAYSVLGMPMDELSGQLVDMHDVLGDAGTGLGDKVRSMATWQERFDEIDRFLLRRAANGPRVVAPEVAHVWRRLVSSGGAVPIRSLSREVGWSHKHLITRFTQQLGFAPKRAARLVRFERVLGRLNDGTPVDWGQVAADFGYADQAHLIRDFGEFAGVSPSAYLASRRSQREVNSVQDDLADVS